MLNDNPYTPEMGKPTLIGCLYRVLFLSAILIILSIISYTVGDIA